MDMVIAFCGHSNYISTACDETKMLNIFETEIGDAPCDFFLGGYGGFDEFALKCAKRFKQSHSSVRLILITPYLSTKKLPYSEHTFDAVVYPELEKIPPKYAISHRNRWIIEKADIVISFVSHQYGGAYAMYSYAKRKNKKIYNLISID